MKPIAIIKCGYTDVSLQQQQGDFEDWIMKGCQQTKQNFLVINAKNQTEYPAIDQLSGVIITGSHDNITDNKPWMNSLCQWLTLLPGKHLPVLGICFGHQVLGHALGGKVGYHPAGGEYGLITIHIDPKKIPHPFFTELPETVYAFASHEQTVLELPAGGFAFGSNPHDKNHFVQFAPLIWGCQFHPEFNQVASDFYAQQAGLDVSAQLPYFTEAEQAGNQILSNFARFCANNANG